MNNILIEEFNQATKELVKGSLNGNVVNFKSNQYEKQLNEYLDNICKSMEIIENLKYLGCERVDDTHSRKRNISIAVSRTFELKFKFSFKKVDKETGEETNEEFSLKLELPELINGNYFIINSTKYNSILRLNNYKPIYQKTAFGVDVSFKTLINNFSFSVKNELNKNKTTMIKVFKKNINFALVLLALKGSIDDFLNEVFGEDSYSIVDFDKDLIPADKLGYINLKEKLVIFDNINLEPWQLLLIKNLNNCKLQYSKLIHDEEYLIKQIGKKFSTNTNMFYAKGYTVLSAVNRSLDEITAKLLKVDSMFNLLLQEFRNVSFRESLPDRNDIESKKIKYLDSLLFPFYKRISLNIYTYLNSRRKNISNVFKINSDIIIKHITSSDAINYHDLTNKFDAMAIYKLSLAANNISKENIGKKSRNLSESNIGFLDIFSSPNGKTAGLSSFMNIWSNAPEKFMDEDGIFYNDLNDIF